jgi:hypothetical protein
MATDSIPNDSSLPTRSAGVPAAIGAVLKNAPAWAVSLLVHVIVLLSMALIVSQPPPKEKARVIVSGAPETLDAFEDFDASLPEDLPVIQESTDEVVMSDVVPIDNVQVVSTSDDVDAAPLSVELSDFGTETAAPADMLATAGAIGGTAGGLGGRVNAATRNQLVAAGGGSSQSEAAVEAALKWFIQHQLPDGGWSFDLKQCPSCKGQCGEGRDKGVGEDRCGATALALLPFLGRGYTHKEGPYKRQLEAGLTFLAGMAVKGNGKVYDKGGNMYSQGLAGIVLSESYAMSQDKRLQAPAQLALNFITQAQDPIGGGWRYSPKQPGDTSAVGWQLMALKSGNMAFLQVNPQTVKKAVSFLDSVQSDDGAAYGYVDKNTPGAARNAVGLLCRMYLGWKKNHPAMERGVANLAKGGPSSDLYHDYYATQVLHHMEGEQWVSWNNTMRDMLVSTQSKKGHEAGSWFEGVNGGHGADAAGRLYCTSLATMILEVYYRHLPIYGQQSVEEDFKE